MSDFRKFVEDVFDGREPVEGKKGKKYFVKWDEEDDELKEVEEDDKFGMIVDNVKKTYDRYKKDALDVYDEYRKLDYMTDGGYTGIEPLDMVLESEITRKIVDIGTQKIPNKVVGGMVRAIPRIPEYGAHVARVKVAYDNSRKK